jgi:hypothetical protein
MVGLPIWISRKHDPSFTVGVSTNAICHATVKELSSSRCAGKLHYFAMNRCGRPTTQAHSRV